MSALYWTEGAAAQLIALDEPTRRAICRRVELLKEFPHAGVRLRREWAGFRKLAAWPTPWLIVYEVPAPDTVVVAYLRHGRSNWLSEGP